RPAHPSRATGCSNSSTPWGFPCCARLPRVHAVANTPAQRLSSSLLDPPVVSVFPGSGAGSTRAFSISRIARRSLVLRPAHSRRHQSRDALHRRLRLLRYLHSRSGCFRLEHSPDGTLTHWKTPPFHGAPAFGKLSRRIGWRLLGR